LITLDLLFTGWTQMSFNPYHKWLGIPLQDQPANHYRLLGVEPFENDADVIDGAADQRMAHLRKFQSGEHAKLSQKLLNEVSAARITLLNPKKRAQYDAHLQSTLDPLAPLPGGSNDVLAAAAMAEQAPAALPQTAGPRVAKKQRRPQKRTPAWVMPAVIGAVSLFVLLGLGVVLIAMRSKKATPGAEVVLASPSDPITVVEENTPSPSDPPEPAPTDPAPPMDPPAPKDPVAEPEPDPAPNETPAIDPSKPIPPDPVLPKPPVEAPVEPSPPGKLPVPAIQDQEPIKKRLQSVFDFGSASTPELQVEMAGKLLELANDSEVDPAERYVLLTSAKDLASEAGDIPLAVTANEQLSGIFEIERLQSEYDLLTQASKGVKSAQAAAAYLTAAEGFIDRALSADQIAWANDVAGEAYSLASKRGVEVAVRKKAYDQKNRVGDLFDEWQSVRDAIASLESSPNNPATNLIAGKWFCFSQGDWKRGLPCLARSNDPQLQPLAELDLKSAGTYDELLEVGDRWLKASAVAPTEMKAAMTNRAGRMYVLAEALSPEEDAQLTQRLKEFGDLTELRQSIIQERRPDGKKILFVGFFKSERTAAERGCQRSFMEADFVKSCDKDRSDYGDYHTIMFGTNGMDYFGRRANKEPEAFQHYEAFVRSGGHLVVFGTYNGRNWEHLRRFGIRTGFNHNGSFARTEASDLFFQGVEDLVPDDNKMRSAGHFNVSEPHTMLLARGSGSLGGKPAMTTMAVDQGRLTATMCEPNWMGDTWLIQVVVHWVSRGSPTPETADPAAS